MGTSIEYMFRTFRVPEGFMKPKSPLWFSSYDKLIIAVGSVASTHSVPGLEHCFQLKTISDAQAIRRRIMDNFEAATLPTTTPEERKHLLSFVVCGGGPTGVETAAVCIPNLPISFSHLLDS
jgi:NADH dehydrogenase FAD-containing subunit